MIIRTFKPDGVVIPTWSFVVMIEQDSLALQDWCQENLRGKWELMVFPGGLRDDLFWLSVHDSKEAMMFKLAWPQ